MKPINFLHTIPAREQRAIAMWYRITGLLTVLVLLSVVVIQLAQCKQWYDITRQKETITRKHRYDKAVLEQHQQLTAQETELHKKQQLIAQMATQRMQLVELIKSALDVVPNHSWLSAGNVTNTDYALSLVCASPQLACTYRDALAQHPSVKSLRITALQPYSHGQGLLCAELSGVATHAHKNHEPKTAVASQ